MDGIFNILKPSGTTSYSVVAEVKRLTGERRVGHAGTLDPGASGVLPVCLGKGTRVIQYLMETRKVYRAVIEFGIATDTYDASGRVMERHDPSGVQAGDVETALGLFRGRIEQVPPMYSALKHQGQPLYKLARAGITVERKSRPADIFHLELTCWQPPSATLLIECGKGTYIRSLAHDLGIHLGCGAVLTGLVREGCGAFYIDSAVELEQLKEAFGVGFWQHYLHPLDSAITHIPAVVVADENEGNIRKGVFVTLGEEEPPQGTICRAYNQEGLFLAMLRYDTEQGAYHPDKVFV